MDAYFCNGKAHLYLDVTGERVSHFYELHLMKIPESAVESLLHVALSLIKIDMVIVIKYDNTAKYYGLGSLPHVPMWRGIGP